MALMTGEEYIDSIKKLNMQIYLLGKKINNPVGNPILAPSLNAVKMTYDLAQDVEYRSLLTAVSHLTGHVINRFTHIHQSREDHLPNRPEIRNGLSHTLSSVPAKLPGTGSGGRWGHDGSERQPTSAAGQTEQSGCLPARDRTPSGRHCSLWSKMPSDRGLQFP